MTRAKRAGDVPAVPLGPASGALLGTVTVAGLAMFAWPLFAPVAADDAQHAAEAPYLFMALLPLLVALVMAQLADGSMDTKALAMLGVMSALTAAVRPLGAGLAGIETVFFLLILAGRVFGPGFGFVLGCSSLFTSALLTGGVGPWLPFQMLACAWVSMGAGLLPGRVGRWTVRGRLELVMLCIYGVAAAYLFGLVMNLWMWPFLAGDTMGSSASLAFVPGAPLGLNVKRFLVFTLVTSTGVWDTGRAITDVVGILALGPLILGVLRRASRRARFDAQGVFASAGHLP